MSLFYFILLILPISTASLAQGKLMLVGGGSESKDGWSNTPYSWAINNSTNKKVAVISYSDQDQWLIDYFKDLGAVAAENIRIDTRGKADLQATYDLLMEYDVFFIKGGDQSYYYNLYKDTKTELAIRDKFNAGGVIAGTSAGMAILSEVIFSAQNGSAYPDDALQNFRNSDITLVNDFLPFLPGIIVDSHFTERGRGARLLAFMANWFIENGELLTGIGVDDRTALCINENKMANVYGTGCVSIYSGNKFSAYQNQKPLTDSVHVTQLLHGHTIDLNQFEIIEGPENPLIPKQLSEDGNYQVFLSGSEGLSTNLDFLDYLVNTAGEITDSIVVVTAFGMAAPFIKWLQDQQTSIIIVETSAENNDVEQIELRNAIRRAKKVLFIENEDNSLFHFLSGGATGVLLRGLLKRNGIVSAFVGEDSRYAGKLFVTNHLSDQYAAYYGRLTYNDGLGLLPSTIIMANTYDAATTDFYENTTASIPFAMVSDSLKYGVYLNRNSYFKFYQENSTNYFTATGSLSTILVVNAGTNVEFASQPVSTAGASRDYVGFSAMQYILLNGEEKIKVGVPKPVDDEPYEFEKSVVGIENDFNNVSLTVFPNPSKNGTFTLSTNKFQGGTSFTICDFMGRILENGILNWDIVRNIDLSSCADGIYYLTIKSDEKRYALKLIKGP